MLLRFWIVFIVFFLIDQITKLLTINYIKLPLGQYNTPVIENFLSIYPLYNEGNVLGFFEVPLSTNLYKLIYLISAIIVSFGCFWVVKVLSKTQYKKITFYLSWAMGLISGAYFGNAIDRFFHIGVIDFIQFHSLPVVFNLADIFAFVGALISLTIATFVFLNFKEFNKLKLF